MPQVPTIDTIQNLGFVQKYIMEQPVTYMYITIKFHIEIQFFLVYMLNTTI